LGISHPPGYPLYCQFAKGVTSLPIGDYSQRANVFSAWCSAISLAVIFWLIADERRIIGGVIAAGIVATSPTLWRAATMSEVYSMNLMIVLLILFCIKRRNHQIRLSLITAAAFLLGLSCGLHLTIVLLLPSLMIMAYGFRQFGLHGFAKAACLSLCFMILGMSILLYDPIRALSDAPVKWGMPSSLDRFWTLITAQEEALPSFSTGLHDGKTITVAMLSLIRGYAQDISLAVILVTLVLLPAAIRKNLQLSLALLVGCLAYTVPVALYHTNEPEFFSLPVPVFLGLLCGEGVAGAFDSSLIGGFPQRKRVFLLILLGIVIHRNLDSAKTWEQLTARKQQVPRIYGKLILENLPSNGVLVTERSDLAFLLWYLQDCEGYLDQRALFFRHLFSFNWADQWHRRKFSWLTYPNVSKELFEDTERFNTTYLEALILCNRSIAPTLLADPGTFFLLQPRLNQRCSAARNGWLISLDCGIEIDDYHIDTNRLPRIPLVDDLSCDVISKHLWGLSVVEYEVGDKSAGDALMGLAGEWKAAAIR